MRLLTKKQFASIRNLPPVRRGKRAWHYRHGHFVGGHRSPTYISWMGMIQRCENPNNPAYPSYGGHGIRVIAKWHDFREFLREMGLRPVGRTLDRVPNTSKVYSRRSCRWATRSQQVQNRRITDKFRKSARQNMVKARAAQRKP
jgi:hypothetical protein